MYREFLSDGNVNLFDLTRTIKDKCCHSKEFTIYEKYNGFFVYKAEQ